MGGGGVTHFLCCKCGKCYKCSIIKIGVTNLAHKHIKDFLLLRK